MTRKIKPLGKRVLVKLVPKKDTTDTGIILPDSQVQDIPRGHIIELGEECTSGIKVGDEVEWEMTSNFYNVEHDGQNCVVLHEGLFILKYV
tara:strand:- start:47 stop:319 length:273 start_codon:yes stop_codon:yes gene_type:complete